MRTIWNNPLGREIVLILIVKIIAIGLIWWVFFRPIGSGAPLDANQVSAAVVSQQQHITRSTVAQPATRSRQDD